MSHQVVSLGKLRVVEPRSAPKLVKFPPAPDAEPADELTDLERLAREIEHWLEILKTIGPESPASRGRGRPRQTERDLRIHLYRDVMGWTYREIGQALGLGLQPWAIGRASDRGKAWFGHNRERLERELPGADKCHPHRRPDPDFAAKSIFDRGRW